MSIRLSVVIPTFGRQEWLGRTCRSVLEQLPTDGELIVVEQNDPPSGIEREFAQELRAGRVQWHHVRPASLPGARNFGARQSRGELVVFLDDDVTLSPGCLESHVRAHALDPQPIAVVGRVAVQGAEAPDSVPLPIFGPDGFQDGSFNHTRSGWCSTVIGCNMSYQREAVLGVGGFDTSFRGSALREESDLVARLRAATNRGVWFEAGAALQHHLAPSGGCRATKVLESPNHYRNLSIFAFRALSPVRWAGYWIGLYVGCVWWSKYSPALFASRNRAFFRGVCEGFLRAWWPDQFSLAHVGGGKNA